MMLELEQTTFEELAQEALSVNDLIPLSIAQLQVQEKKRWKVT
jgi:hypothetical protein